MTRPWIALGAALVLALATSCATYHPPGRGADMKLFTPKNDTEQSIAEAFERKPAAPWPATLAVVRVQASGYVSSSIHHTAGDGAYSVVTVRDIETEEDFQRLGRLPQIAAVAPFNKLLLGGELTGPENLRRAAADLQADLVLVYTVDTVFRSVEHGGVLTILSLGVLPTTVASVDTTSSAIVLDTRTGYLYAAAEATESRTGNTSVWWNDSTADNYRRDTERKSFDKLLAELESVWPAAIAPYVPKATVGPAAGNGG